MVLGTPQQGPYRGPKAVHAGAVGRPRPDKANHVLNQGAPPTYASWVAVVPIVSESL